MTKMIKLHVENIHDITPEDGHVAENCPEKSADGSCALETCDPGTGIAVLNSADVEDERVPSSGGNAEDGNSSGITVDESSTAPGNDGTINEKCFINILDPGEDLVTENCSKRSADGSCAMDAYILDTGITVQSSATVDDELVPSPGGNAEDGNPSGTTVNECRAVVVNKTRALANMMSLSVQEPARNVLTADVCPFYIDFSRSSWPIRTLLIWKPMADCGDSKIALRLPHRRTKADRYKRCEITQEMPLE
ncbi:uncharacterized protein LOC112681131 [Sipha flava]|uniref:Uncharacterized protein LOC112681131 n=1 Tax=Sipha flava TaxID=143950 RepID=A0A8B8F8L8_9HEMI|nr:uncharacterized protein LOC112681131 [Sipha flava]